MPPNFCPSCTGEMRKLMDPVAWCPCCGTLIYDGEVERPSVSEDLLAAFQVGLECGSKLTVEQALKIIQPKDKD